jgi:hypothetical protein
MLLPIVQPELVARFEAFAYSYYEANPQLYTSAAGVSSFGEGVYAVDPDSGLHFHDVDGSTVWDSPYTILTPVLQMEANRSMVSRHKKETILMRNMHADQYIGGHAIDAVLDCLMTNEKASKSVSSAVHLCSVASLAINNALYVDASDKGDQQGLFIHTPVVASYSDNAEETASIQLVGEDISENNVSVVGFIVSHVPFVSLLSNRMHEHTEEVLMVVTSKPFAYSYLIKQGALSYLGAGDYHGSKVSKDRVTFRVDKNMDPHVTTISEDFIVQFYPAHGTLESEYYDIRDEPWVYCISGVCIVLGVVIILVVFDYFVTLTQREHEALLEAKRVFVRYISHEVRSPLNAVAMANTMLTEEVRRSCVCVCLVCVVCVFVCVCLVCVVCVSCVCATVSNWYQLALLLYYFFVHVFLCRFKYFKERSRYCSMKASLKLSAWRQNHCCLT